MNDAKLDEILAALLRIEKLLAQPPRPPTLEDEVQAAHSRLFAAGYAWRKQEQAKGGGTNLQLCKTTEAANNDADVFMVVYVDAWRFVEDADFRWYEAASHPHAIIAASEAFLRRKGHIHG